MVEEDVESAVGAEVQRGQGEGKGAVSAVHHLQEGRGEINMNFPRKKVMNFGFGNTGEIVNLLGWPGSMSASALQDLKHIPSS